MAITGAQLIRWRAGDWRDFVRTCCIMKRPDGTIGPFEPSETQAEWLDALVARRADGLPQFTTLGIVESKRSGKTTFAAVAALFITAIGEDRLTIFLGNSRESAESLSFEQVKEFIRRGPLKHQADVQRGRILFASLNSEMRAVPNSPKTVAGVTVTGALISDELWQAWPDEESWQLLSSQKSPGAQTIMVSQSSGLQSAVYKLFESAQKPDAPDHLYLSYHSPEWYDEHGSPNPFIDADFLQERRVELGTAAAYDHYFRNCWSSGGGKLLASEDVAAAVLVGVDLPHNRKELEDLLAPYGGAEVCAFASGLDRAMPGSGAGDDTFFVTTARTKPDAHGVEYVLPVQVEELPTGARHEVEGAWASITEILGRRPPLLCEIYQSKDLADAIGADVVTPSGPRQNEAFTALARLFTERRMKIPEGAAVLLKQLQGFACDTSTQPPRYGKKVNGSPDDSVYGLCWSCYQLGEVPGYVEITVDVW